MKQHADIGLILEGSYPYIRGGVSSWTDDLIRMHPYFRFHVTAIIAHEEDAHLRYTLPDNVIGVDNLCLNPTKLKGHSATGIIRQLRPFLQRLMVDEATLDDLRSILSIIGRRHISADYMLNSREAWEVLTDMYEEAYDESSILDYFWSWRAMVGNLLAVINFTIPKADAYHCMSTGYAGLLASRIKIETGKPVFLTEHGIYTNERRIEIASADWLMETASRRYTIDHTNSNLRDLWMNTFTNYSRITYEAADRIITLFEGNQIVQREDGADAKKMAVIPNGIDIARFAHLKRERGEYPTIALIGRVVPIKDIKSFIRACAILRNQLPGLKAYILGPTDEDQRYYEECRQMVQHYSLEDTVEFTGLVKIEDYLEKIDILVLTSISEAQPLVILEAAACGIPVVATNVGACSELINGNSREEIAIAPSGIVTPVSNPTATAQAIIRLLADDIFYARCAEAGRLRVHHYYNRDDQQSAYQTIYDNALGQAA